MNYLLPLLKSTPRLFLTIRDFLKPENLRFILPSSKKPRFSTGNYKFAALLDLILIAAILLTAKQPVQSFVSPLNSSLNSFYAMALNQTTKSSFAFVPDLAPNKFPNINLEGLTYLSFFDVPLTKEGGLNIGSYGYASFTSGEASELFDRARYQNTKIFLTLSALEEEVIQSILQNNEAQQTLADEAVWAISNFNLEGITIDFELPANRGKYYQKEFTNFVSLLRDRIRFSLPLAQIAVAVPSSQTDNKSLYHMEDLGKGSDQLFLVANNLIVPETSGGIPINPVYGFNQNEYWPNISNLLSNLHNRIPVDKLVLERAWYGNGNNYPLYVPNISNRPENNNKSATAVQLDNRTIENLVAGVPLKGQQAARVNIPLIAQALQDEGILDTNVLAYALATIEHETDETFAPIDEIGGAINARRFGYEGGANYFGRGFIQITHLRNYKTYGERVGLGEQLVRNPELASDPQIAAKILAAFFKDNNVANLASQGNFVAARTPINPDYNGWSIANIALKYDLSL